MRLESGPSVILSAQAVAAIVVAEFAFRRFGDCSASYKGHTKNIVIGRVNTVNNYLKRLTELGKGIQDAIPKGEWR